MTKAEHSAIAGQPILLFDGVCGLCNRLVRILLRLDRAHTLYFVPLQSSLASELLANLLLPPAQIEEGVILITEALTPQAAVYRRSRAILEALRVLPPPWPGISVLLGFMPNFLRERIYGIIARNRYHLFGKFDACPIPTEAQRSRILGM